MEETDKIQFEVEGENHIMTSIDTPMLADAFEKSDDEKIAIIQDYFAGMFNIKQKYGYL